MAGIIESYDLTNTQRGVFMGFEDLRSNLPTIMSIIPIGYRPTAVKHEWNERTLSEATTTISSAPSPATSGTSMTVASIANIAQYDLLWFTSSTGQERSEVVQVTDASTTTLTISRSYGSSTASSLANNDIVHVLKPTKEGWKVTDLTAETGSTSTLNYNYPFTHVKSVEVSGLAELVATYGNQEKMADTVTQVLLKYNREMAANFLNGYRVAPANTTTAKGSCGGVKQFLNGGIDVTTGGVVTLDHINDAMQTLYENGADPGNKYTLWMSPSQARRLSALNTAGTNPLVFINQTSAQAGYAPTTQVWGDIPGISTKVFVDPLVAKDTIYIIDPSRCSVNYYIPFTIKDGTLADASGVNTQVMSSTYTFTIANGTTAHAKVSGLTI